MSLLWPDRFVAVLDPRGVLLTRRRGWGGSPQTVGNAECAAGAEPAWSAAADALAGLLKGPVSGRGELTVVLASQFVRFRLVPWSDEVGAPDELEAYARIRFEEVYGPVSGDWVLRLSPEAAGRPRLAAAIERPLLDRLQAIAANAGLALASVQPYLMAAFNRLAGRLRQDDFMFVLAEPERSTLLVAREGRWTSVSSTVGADTDEALGALIARERELQAAAGETLPTVYVHAPGREACAPAVGGEAPVTLAMPAAPAAGALLNMAMAAR